MASFYEIIIKGDSKVVRAYMEGFMKSKGIEDGIDFGEDHPLDLGHLKEMLKFHGDVLHLVVEAKLSATVNSAIQKAKEGKIHKAAIKELGASVDAEIAPMLVEVEGRTLRLEGSAQAQYAEWRRLLAEIFREETGLGPEPSETSSTDSLDGSGIEQP